MKCDVTKRKEEPNKVKERPTAPLVLISVPGLVAKLAVLMAMAKKNNIHTSINYRGLTPNYTQRHFNISTSYPINCWIPPISVHVHV